MIKKENTMLVVGVYAVIFMLMLPLIVVRPMDYMSRIVTSVFRNLFFLAFSGFMVVQFNEVQQLTSPPSYRPIVLWKLYVQSLYGCSKAN